MFGLGFGELCVIILVGMIVIGPRDLPKLMRKAGQWAGKLRRMAAEARAQSGIDDILKDSTIGSDLHEIRKLARGELDSVVKTTVGLGAISNDAPLALPQSTSSTSHHHEDPYDSAAAAGAREREYPRDGADSYRALPDTALAYGDGYPSSALASDPLYAEADVNAPPRKAPAPPAAAASAEATPPPPADDTEAKPEAAP
jgi:sec-independent protein translocase protein TatB